MRYLITLVFVLLSYLSYGQIVGAQVLAFQGNVTTTVRNTLDVPAGQYWMIYNTTTAQLEVSDDTDTWSAFTAGTDDQTAAEVPITDAGGIITATDVEGALQENRTAIDLNTAKVTNATHTGEVTGSGALTIADNIIEEANLEATNAPTDNYILSYDSASGGFTWVEDSSGAGTVDTSGTPADNQLAIFTDANTIEGSSLITFNGTTFTVDAPFELSQNQINNVTGVEWVYTTGANEVQTGFSGGNDIFFLGGPNDASQSLRYTFSTGLWFYPYDNTTSGLTANNLQSAVDEIAAGGGVGDHSLSVENQTIATGTTRLINAAGTATIGFQQDGTELMRIGNNNDNAVYVNALEALTGNTIGFTSPFALYQGNVLTDAAADYDHALVYDTGDVYYSDGINWYLLGGVTGSAASGISVSGAPVNYSVTPGEEDVQGHLDGIDAALGAIGSGTLPVSDTNSVVEGSADGTKELRFEVDGLTTGTVRVITMKDANIDLNNMVESKTAGLTGADQVLNIVSGTESEIDGWGADANRLDICTDCKTVYEKTVYLTPIGEDLATGTSVNVVPITEAITITEVIAFAKTGPTGSVLTIDINEDDGTPATILSTKLTIDATERTSATAATAAVISDASIAANSFLEFDVDGVGSTLPGNTVSVVYKYTID